MDTTNTFGIVDAEALQQFYKHEQENSGRNQNWLKLTPATHTLRIAPPAPGETSPVVRRTNHDGYKDKEGRKRQPLCLDYVFKNFALAKYLTKAKKLNKKDYDLVSAHGCPMCKLAEAVRNLGVQNERSNRLWPRTVYVWNIIHRGTAVPDAPGGKNFMWSSSRKFFDAVFSQYSVCPDLFDADKGFDFMLTATGEGFAGPNKRQYSAPTFIPAPKPLNFDGKLHNLNAAVADGVKTYHEMLECMVLTTEIADFLAMTQFDVKVFAQ